MSKKQARHLWSLAAQKINKHICVSEFLGLSVNKRHAPISWNYKVDSEGIQTLRWEATAWSKASLHHRSEPWMSCLWSVCRFLRNETLRNVSSLFFPNRIIPCKVPSALLGHIQTLIPHPQISWKLEIWASEVAAEVKNLAVEFMSKFSTRDLHGGGEGTDSGRLSSDFY